MQKVNSSIRLSLLTVALMLGFFLTTNILADSGRIETVEKFTSIYVDTRRVDVWLPDDYSADGPALPVIYAQDGQNLFRAKTAAWGGNEWGVDETIARLVSEKKIRNAIVVGIWNTPKRFLEYGPEKPWNTLPETTKQDIEKEMNDIFGHEHGSTPLSENYLKFMVKELKPFVDENYNTLPDQADTFLMGSSMGGLISIYAISRYPDVYGGAMCLSTHWPISIKNDRADIAGTIIDYIDTVLPEAGTHRIYFDFGTETLDAWYEPHQAKMDKVMESHGYVQGEDWVTRKFEGEPHSEVAWNKRVHIPIEFMLGID